MAKATKTVKVSSTLEIELLAAVVGGAASPSIVNEKELSKIGRIIQRAVSDLAKKGVEAPFSLSTVYIHAISNLGAPEEETKVFLRDIQSVRKTTNASALAKIAREKDALVTILNEASRQLGSGDVQLRKFTELAEKQQDAGEKLTPMSEVEPGEPPQGIMLDSLPTISQAARGVQGVWIIGGYEGIGKSTLALQLAIEIQTQIPVLYYDVDGTSEVWTRYRIEQAVGRDRYREASKSLYYRSDISCLDIDLSSIPAPACLVVDSIQTLPYEVNQRRSSVDSWLNTFKKLSQKGYTILVISELSREGDYKESSGINYAGALNAVVEKDSPDDPYMRFIVKKNRHGSKSGHVATLARNEQYPYWLEEV